MPSRGIMSADTLKNILEKAFAFSDGGRVMLSFQGGEPLLAGKDFFRTLHALIPQLNSKRSPVHIALQTNGTLIDEEWCELFRRGRYLIGLSLDGDRQANSLRVDADGNPTFDKVFESAKLLKKNKVDFNILSVLTKPVAEKINAVYAFFRKQGFKHLQFIPCLKPLRLDENGYPDDNPDYGAFPSEEEDFSLSGKDYENFLKKCFSLYVKDFIDGRYTSVRQFDNFVRLAHSQRAEQCGMNGHCTHQFVIEADGETYPCDFYCIDKYSLGNVNRLSFKDFSKHPVALKFIEDSMGLEEKCGSCKYYNLCKNGCKRERADIDKCEAYKAFFAYALPHLKRMN